MSNAATPSQDLQWSSPSQKSLLRSSPPHKISNFASEEKQQHGVKFLLQQESSQRKSLVQPASSVSISEAFNRISDLSNRQQISKAIMLLDKKQDRVILIDCILRRQKEKSNADEILKMSKVQPLLWRFMRKLQGASSAQLKLSESLSEEDQAAVKSSASHQDLLKSPSISPFSYDPSSVTPSDSINSDAPEAYNNPTDVIPSSPAITTATISTLGLASQSLLENKARMLSIFMLHTTRKKGTILDKPIDKTNHPLPLLTYAREDNNAGGNSKQQLKSRINLTKISENSQELIALGYEKQRVRANELLRESQRMSLASHFNSYKLASRITSKVHPPFQGALTSPATPSNPSDDQTADDAAMTIIKTFETTSALESMKKERDNMKNFANFQNHQLAQDVVEKNITKFLISEKKDTQFLILPRTIDDPKTRAIEISLQKKKKRAIAATTNNTPRGSISGVYTTDGWKKEKKPAVGETHNNSQTFTSSSLRDIFISLQQQQGDQEKRPEKQFTFRDDSLYQTNSNNLAESYPSMLNKMTTTTQRTLVLPSPRMMNQLGVTASTTAAGTRVSSPHTFHNNIAAALPSHGRNNNTFNLTSSKASLPLVERLTSEGILATIKQQQKPVRKRPSRVNSLSLGGLTGSEFGSPPTTERLEQKNQYSITNSSRKHTSLVALTSDRKTNNRSNEKSSLLYGASERELMYRIQRDKTGVERMPLFSYPPAHTYFLEHRRGSRGKAESNNTSVEFKSEKEFSAPKQDFMRTLQDNKQLSQIARTLKTVDKWKLAGPISHSGKRKQSDQKTTTIKKGMIPQTSQKGGGESEEENDDSLVSFTEIALNKLYEETHSLHAQRRQLEQQQKQEEELEAPTELATHRSKRSEYIDGLKAKYLSDLSRFQRDILHTTSTKLRQNNRQHQQLTS